jgi:hypothetical protein
MAFGTGDTWTNASSTNNLIYTTTTAGSTSPVTVPLTITVAPEKPKPETPLEWLRREVDEIRELAWAA